MQLSHWFSHFSVSLFEGLKESLQRAVGCSMLQVTYPGDGKELWSSSASAHCPLVSEEFFLTSQSLLPADGGLQLMEFTAQISAWSGLSSVHG